MLEKALGSALDSDLDAGDDQSSSVHWRDLPPLNEKSIFPTGIETLDKFVNAPSLLKRRLSHIGVVENEEKALLLLKELKAGQRLVTIEGGLWRWDGLCVSPEAPSAAAIRLGQKNRLENLLGEFEEKTKEYDDYKITKIIDIDVDNEKDIFQEEENDRQTVQKRC